MQDQIPTPWRNRIIGSGTAQTDQLLANPLNWRVHPKYQQDVLLTVLDRVGWVQQIIVNQTTGNVVDGHLRVALAMRRDESSVPVLYVELDEDEERLILATLDPIGVLAVADLEQLTLLLQSVRAVEDDITSLVATVAKEYNVEVHPEVESEPRRLIEYCACPTCGNHHHRKLTEEEKAKWENQSP